MHDRKPSFQPIALTLTVLAALLRLAPHPPNFTPVGGIALFGGARLNGWQAYLIPLLAMLITDPILSHMAGYPAYSSTTPIIYFSFLIYVLMGRILIGNSSSPWRIVAVSVIGSVQFFVITNMFVWWSSNGFYPRSLAGLTACYVAALPFFSRTLVADLFYSGVLFTANAVLRRRVEAVAPTSVL